MSDDCGRTAHQAQGDLTIGGANRASPCATCLSIIYLWHLFQDRFFTCPFYFVKRRERIAPVQARAALPTAAGGGCREDGLAPRSKPAVTKGTSTGFGHRKRDCKASSSLSFSTKKSTNIDAKTTGGKS